MTPTYVAKLTYEAQHEPLSYVPAWVAAIEAGIAADRLPAVTADSD